VLGDNVSGYMAEMMKRQGQTPKPAWTFVEQLRKEYQVEKVRTSVAEIGDIDLLLIICLVSQRNDDIYMAITSSFGDTTPVTKGSEVESLDALRTKEARLLAREQAVKFSEKHKGWLYRIPKDSGRHLIQRIESLIE
jgi:hypothetical protein